MVYGYDAVLVKIGCTFATASKFSKTVATYSKKNVSSPTTS